MKSTIEFYEYFGFKHIEVPVLVSKAAIEMTHQYPVTPMVPNTDLYLIGSGEQGFLELELQGKLERGSYVTLTPCWRDEPVLDDLHQSEFVKIELYSNLILLPETLMYTALKYFKGILPSECKSQLNIVTTPDGYDINLGDIEIGSYGRRSTNDINWVYGTALAQPRFDTALNIIKGKLGIA